MQQLVILLLINFPRHGSGIFTPIIRRSDCGVGCFATYPTQCTQLASRLSNITTVTTGQINICSENAVCPPEDGRKDARNMLRNNWLTIKSLIVASSWSQIYLLLENVDIRVGREDITYLCRKIVPMLTARVHFLSLPSTNIASLFFLTTTFATLVRLVFLISLGESADRPHARRYMTNGSCQLK